MVRNSSARRTPVDPIDRLERRCLLASAGTLLQYDFNTAATWSDLSAGVTPGVAASAGQGAVGTIDVQGGTTRTGAVALTVTAAPAGAWASQLASGRLPLANTQTNLGKLTLAFNLSASQARPVTLLIRSFDASGRRTGGLETLVHPAGADAYQRFAVDLSSMKPSGPGTFDPAGAAVSFEFGVGSATGWTTATACQLRVDNVHFARPAYYVSALTGSNARDGLTEATAFATPQKAVSAAQPGDVILLMDGTYNNAAFSFPRGGTPAAWVTVKNYPGQSPLIFNENWNAVLVGRGNSTTRSTAAALGYIEVRGLHVRGNADFASTRYPTAMNQADPRTNNNGISIDGRYETNKPHDIRFADNFVEYCSGQGIGMLEADRVQIENNVVQNTSWWTIYATSGISVFSAYTFDGTSGTYTRLVRNNLSSGNQTFNKWKSRGIYSDGNGIIIDVNHNNEYNTTGVTTGRTLVTNNVTFNNGGSGIHTVSADHVDIVNNVAYLNSASPQLQYPQIFANGSTDVRMYNNVMVAPVANTAAGEPAEAVNNGVAAMFRNNVYFGGNKAPLMGSGDVIAEPKFVRPSIDAALADFRLQANSPAVNRGTAALAPVIDFAYAPRYAAPDAGAYEYVPPAPAVALAAASDTGTPGDNKTRLNNTPGKPLSFVVSGTVSGATVRLYAGSVLLGTATAAGPTTTVTTAGTAPLTDGTAAVSATQTLADAPSSGAPALNVTIDATRPTLVGTPVINRGAASAASRSQVRTVSWTFSEPVGVVLADFILTDRDTGRPVSLASRAVSTSGNVVTLRLDDPATDASPGLFLADANYELALSPAVGDDSGNTLDDGRGAAGGTPRVGFHKLTGDFTGDRRVTSTDYLFWTRAYGQTVGGDDAGVDAAFDLNADRKINSTDYLLWTRTYGRSLAPLADGLFS